MQYPIDGQSIDVLHHEVEQLVGSRAGIQQPRDVGVLEPREQFPLAQEPVSQRQEPRGQELHRHALGKRAVVALGQIDSTRAAGAEQSQQTIRTDDAPCQFRYFRQVGKGGQELPWTFVRFEQRGHLGGGAGVAALQVRQERVPVDLRAFQYLLEQVRDSRPRHGRHRISPSSMLAVWPIPVGATTVHLTACHPERRCDVRAQPGSRAQLTTQPRARDAPVPLHGLGRHVQHLRRLFDGHATEVPEFDDLRLAWIERREPVESAIEVFPTPEIGIP